MKVLKLTAFVVAICLVPFSCKKDHSSDRNKIQSNLPEYLSPSPPGDTYPPEEDPWADARNEENPYDANGYYHNMNLDYIFANIGSDSSNSNIYGQSINYIEAEFGSNVADYVTDELPFASSTISGLFNVIDDLSISAYQSGINSLPVRTVVKNELSDLLHILTDTTRLYFLDYEVTKSLLVSWESNLDAGLTSAERESLLRAGSIARYSGLYWHIYGENIGGYGFLRWLGWALVGAADAIGGFIGTSACGPACGIGIGAAGSFLGYKIFKARGWEP